MKLVRFIYNGREHMGELLRDNRIAIFEGNIFNHKKRAIGYCKISEIKFLPPINPSKIVCIGFNYKKHMDEIIEIATKKPTLTLKSQNAVIGHNDFIVLPRVSDRVEHEAELGIIIKREGYRIKNPDEYILGYTIVNDVTARDIEKDMVQWSAGKSFPTFCPIGPCIETELNPENLWIRCWVNNKLRQKDNTRNMLYNPFKCVEFVSRFMKLQRGDLIATGTVPGVGILKNGDVVDIKIDGIGILRNMVKSE